MKKITFIQLSTLITSLSSSMAIAAENNSTDASFAGWPLPLFIALLFIFRKKIFTEKNIDYLKEDNHNSVATEQQEKMPHSNTASSEKKPSPKNTSKIIVNPKKKEPKANTSSKNINNDSQCQASTAKGTRCKRTTSLEKTSITIGNQTYNLTVCNQHNNTKLKPFPELIK